MDPLRQLVLGAAEVVEQLLVGRRLFERVQLRPVEVLQERVAQQVLLGRADDRRDGVEAGLLRGAEATLAHDELVLPVAHGSDHDRL